MLTIYKYPFYINDRVSIVMPEGAKILNVVRQGDINVMLALVDTNRTPETRNFAIYGTGHTIYPEADVSRHVATWMDGVFVCNMFEI